MQLINTNGILNFIAEGNETAAEQDFLARIRQYTIKANGANIHIYDQQERLMLSINPFDNTQFICADDGYQLATEFGAKRFLMSEARRLVTQEKNAQSKAIHFARDLTFPISGKDVAVTYQMLTAAQAEHKFRTNKNTLYLTLAELFNRCADFTPGKQDEYLSGGAQVDKFCRFNTDGKVSKNTPYTHHIFLADDNDKIVGTISATVIESDNDNIDMYFYDEVVDYFTLLSEKERAAVHALTEKLRTATEDAEKSELKKELAGLIEPFRTRMMEQLFTAARISLRNTINNLDARIEKGLVRAFIRAADGRVENYAALGCSKTNTENFVIHGPSTAQLKMLDAHIKAWASEKLMALQPRVSAHTAISQRAVPSFETSGLNPEERTSLKK